LTRLSCVAVVFAWLIVASPCCGAAARAFGSDIALYTMDCGRLTIRDADTYADDGSLKGVSREMVDPCYLVRDRGIYLLWDAGLPDKLATMRGGVRFPQWRLRMPKTLRGQLAQIALLPGDIKYFAISHSHLDHIGNAGLFGGATFLIDPVERAFMFQPDKRQETINWLPVTASEYAHALDTLEHAHTIEIPHDAPYDVFGDGAAVIYAAPGHTPGHRVLLLSLPHSGPVILAGDLWNIAECLKTHCVERRPNEIPATPAVHAQILSSQRFVEELAAKTGARIVRQHVVEDFLVLPRFPKALY
jgi:N-acyl homoserine lactone hydrolase